MKHHIVTASFIFCSQLVFAQRIIDVSKTDMPVGPGVYFTVAGQPFVTAKFVELTEGTPYFKTEYLPAVGVDERGKEYKNFTAKLDLFDKQILYLENGKELILVTPLKEIIITDTAGNNYRFVRFNTLNRSDKVIAENWYQWLTSGKTALYKQFKKNLSEYKPFGSSLTNQKIITKEYYLIYHNNIFLEPKKLKDVPSLLSDKKNELENFLKNKDVDTDPMDDRFKAIIDYYNTLFAEKK